MSTFAETLAKTDHMQQRIKAFGAFPPEIKKKLQYKFRLDWNYYSNSMEGNTLTKAETRDVMIGVLNVAGKPLKDVLEMKGHNDVVEDIMRMGKGDIRLSEKRIKDIHRGIMHEDEENKKDDIGHWKKHPNHIINYQKEKFNFAAPEEVADKVHDLLNHLNAGLDAINTGKKGAPHPLSLIFQFHLDYLTIHPFQDGNGRTARILTNLLLISFDYPPIIIRKEDKDAYYRYLGDIQGYGGKPDLLFTYMGNLLLRSQQLVLDALEGKEIEEVDDIEKEIALWKKEQEEKPLTKSQAAVIEFLNQFVVLLFNQIDFRIVNNFSSLFERIEKVLLVNGNAQKTINKNIGVDVLFLAIKNESKDVLSINNISLTHTLKAYTRGEKAFTISTTISVDLQCNHTLISIDGQKLGTFPYGVILDNAKDELSTQAIKLIFEQIKQKAG